MTTLSPQAFTFRTNGTVQMSESALRQCVHDALGAPTLTEALSGAAYVIQCLVSQARVIAHDPQPLPRHEFERVFKAIRVAWIEEGRSLEEFQPNFCPPPPPRD